MNEDERRFDEICRHKFDKLEKGQDRLQETVEQLVQDMGKVKVKIFNGLGDAIAEIRLELRALRGLMWGLIGTVVAALIVAAIKVLFMGS